jgi:hypothetical protein
MSSRVEWQDFLMMLRHWNDKESEDAKETASNLFAVGIV